MFPVQKMILNVNGGLSPVAGIGKPSIPLNSRQIFIEKKNYDPSSSPPKGERYPIPSFFEYRIKPGEYDLL